MPFAQVTILGISVSKMNMQETVQYLTEAIQHNTSHQVVTINPIMVMLALDDPRFMAAFTQADLVIPDGTGIVWAANRQGNPVQERVAGYDLLHELMQTGMNHHWKVYLLGASPDVVKEAAARLQDLYPGIEVVGHRDGYFSLEDSEQVIDEIRQAAPHILFVANTPEKQDLWIHEQRDQLDIPVMMGVGGSFDVIAGKVKRAPKLFQKLRLEWFYRLVLEPTRFKRMLALPKFMLKIIRANEKQQ